MPESFEDFRGRRILLTGASRGIAAAIARGLARAGATVVVNWSAAADSTADCADAIGSLVGEIEEFGGHAETVEGDLTQPGAARRVADGATAAGPVDGLVLSASVQVHAQFLRQTETAIARQFQINLTSNIELLQRILPGMADRGFGRVLAIGSVQELAPSPEMPIYAMTKAALKNLMENLAVSHARHGVTFNVLSPGLVQTDRNAFRRVDADAWQRASASANPLGRAGQPEEMVAPALYLLSRDAAFVTGATLYATGGAHLAAPRPLAETPDDRPNDRPEAAE